MDAMIDRVWARWVALWDPWVRWVATRAGVDLATKAMAVTVTKGVTKDGDPRASGEDMEDPGVTATVDTGSLFYFVCERQYCFY